MFLTLFLQSAPSQSPLGGTLFMFLPMIAIFYFLLFLPMQRQKKQTAKMLAGLQNGDTVVTSGGIVGTIVTLDSDTVVLRVKPDNIKLQVARSAVSSLVSSTSSTEVKK
ncbi:MAG TPA: preprotein translocase subunit YajC [Candidatus Acidoferrales bacterium]|nr:preprotein translocase subunit YajC [Candidatus Acidoferrales bacterium]